MHSEVKEFSIEGAFPGIAGIASVSVDCPDNLAVIGGGVFSGFGTTQDVQVVSSYPEFKTTTAWPDRWHITVKNDGLFTTRTGAKAYALCAPAGLKTVGG